MTKVLVHGVPETAELWAPLIASLGERGVDDVVTLSPPGFGATVPDGWEASPANYVAWLAERVAAISGPVDLLGHDWGAGHVYGLAAEQPSLIRSYAADCAGLLSPDYVWHELAQVWQTPDAGEEAVAGMGMLSVDDRTAAYVGLGLGESVARAMAEGFTDTMGACILTLYRGAVPPFVTDLGDRLAAADERPSLVIDATQDPYVPSELTTAVAARRSQVSTLTLDRGHWWMADDTGPVADALVEFWNGLG